MIGEIPYFVEKERPVVRLFKLSGPVGPGVRKGSFDVSEKFAFEEGLGQGAHIHRYQLLFPAAGQAVNLAGQHLFSCTVLSRNQDICIRPGYFFY